LQFAGRCAELAELAVEQAIGQGPTDTLVEEGEHQGDADAFLGQAVGITVAKPDDMKTDPAGNAGDRIACVSITK
jgi:Cu/Zn superoxide dismutase